MQQPDQQSKCRQLNIRKIEKSIKIDGVEDPIWLTADLTSDFTNHRPSDIGSAQNQTEVRILYNSQFIYILIKAYQKSSTQIIQNLKRDNFFDNDGFGVVLDPINKQTDFSLGLLVEVLNLRV